MIPEFLAFRYQGLRRVHEIEAKPSDLGWKCRKYIKWREVHNSQSDAKALYAFAEQLIEHGNLSLELFGQVSSVCLNVQKWRLDKEKLAVDPPCRKEWETCDVLFKAAIRNPALMPARLAERRVSTERLGSLHIQVLFFVNELDAFFTLQGIASYPVQPLIDGLLGCGCDEWSKAIQTRFDQAYRSVGCSLQKCKDASQLVQQVLEDLGLQKATFRTDLTFAAPVMDVPNCVIELLPLSKFRLIEVSSAAGVTCVRLNANHRFFKKLALNGSLPPEMEIFIKCYAQSILRMPSAIDTLETFNSHLGMELHTAS